MGERIASEIEVRIDPDVVALLRAVEAAAQPPLEAQTPAEGRAAFGNASTTLFTDAVDCDRADFMTSGAAIDIPVRRYRPQGSGKGKLPALFFFHGGGWVVGSVHAYDGLCSRIAADAGIAVLSVDYRLAPEHRFPAALDDCLAAIDWVTAHADRLEIDPERIGVGGDSAGGNLAAVTALAMRDRGASPLRAQLLLYPVTDLLTEHPSYQRNGHGFMLTAATMRWCRDHYLGSADAADWRTSPLLADTMNGLPPTYLATCGLDPLCDEGQAYARRIKDEGGTVELAHYPDQIHGFISLGRAIRAADGAIAEICAFLRATLEE